MTRPQRVILIDGDEDITQVVACLLASTGQDGDRGVEPSGVIDLRLLRTAASPLDARMDGIVWGESDADELVSVDHTLRQIVNVKGD